MDKDKILIVTDLSFKTGFKFGLGIAVGTAVVRLCAQAVGSKIFDEPKS